MEKIFLVIDDKKPGVPFAAFADRTAAEAYCKSMESGGDDEIWYAILEMDVQ